MKKTPTQLMEDYLKTYSGRELLKKYSLDDVSVWQIFGEDPNADLHGAHHCPDLGIYRGSLRHIILYGVILPKFWQWGAGGEFKKIGVIQEITEYSGDARLALEEEARELTQRLSEINSRLGK